MPREARDMRERRDVKFEVRDSEFWKSRTSHLEPSPVLLVQPVARLSWGFFCGPHHWCRWAGALPAQSVLVQRKSWALLNSLPLKIDQLIPAYSTRSPILGSHSVIC